MGDNPTTNNKQMNNLTTNNKQMNSLTNNIMKGLAPHFLVLLLVSVGVNGTRADYHESGVYGGTDNFERPSNIQDRVKILGGRDYKAPIDSLSVPYVATGYHMWTLLDVQLPSGAKHTIRFENWGYEDKEHDRSALVTVYALDSAPSVPWDPLVRFDHATVNGPYGTKYDGKEGEMFRQWKVPTTVSLTPVLDLLKDYAKREYRLDTHSCQTLVKDIHQKVGGGAARVVVESGPQNTTKTANWLFTQRAGALVWRLVAAVSSGMHSARRAREQE